MKLFNWVFLTALAALVTLAWIVRQLLNNLKHHYMYTALS